MQKKETTHRSVLILRLVSFFLHQSLHTYIGLRDMVQSDLDLEAIIFIQYIGRSKYVPKHILCLICSAFHDFYIINF